MTSVRPSRFVMGTLSSDCTPAGVRLPGARCAASSAATTCRWSSSPLMTRRKSREKEALQKQIGIAARILNQRSSLANGEYSCDLWVPRCALQAPMLSQLCRWQRQRFNEIAHLWRQVCSTCQEYDQHHTSGLGLWTTPLRPNADPLSIPQQHLPQLGLTKPLFDGC